MSYCVLSDIKNQMTEAKIIQHTDDEQLKPSAIDAGNPDHANIVARIADAIASADDEIDSYCGVKYTVPFSAPPGEVKRLSVEISIYNLYKRRMVPEAIEKRYDKAIAQLKDIAKGLKTLGIDPPPAAPTQAGAEVNKTESDRIFTKDKLSGY